MATQWQPVAEWIQENAPGAEKVIAYQDAGWIGYALEADIIDFGRLNDRYLAHVQPDPPAAADYFFEQQAPVVVMTSFDLVEYTYFEEAMTIQRDPRFAQYELKQRFVTPGVEDYAQFVYIRSEGTVVSVDVEFIHVFLQLLIIRVCRGPAVEKDIVEYPRMSQVQLAEAIEKQSWLPKVATVGDGLVIFPKAIAVGLHPSDMLSEGIDGAHPGQFLEEAKIGKSFRLGDRKL